MNDQASRMWWPFEVIVSERQTHQHKVEIDFLVRASGLGCRAYKEGSDFGAIAGDARECRIAWHGNHRRQLLLIDRDRNVRQQLFVSVEAGAAFREAADAGIAFLQQGALVQRKAI